MTDPWIVVPNWDKFQHYKNRRPVWIKLYTDLANRDEWLDLTDAERGLLVRIWIAYAESNGRLRASRMRQGGTRHTPGHLRRLNDAGFIEFSDSAELEVERERSKPVTAQLKIDTLLKDLEGSLRPVLA